jgi:hypothetical protein
MVLEGRHFREVMRRKGALVLIVVAQAVVLPALGFLLTRAMALPLDLSAGILLLAACPVGDIASVYTLLARANVLQDVSYVVDGVELFSWCSVRRRKEIRGQLVFDASSVGEPRRGARKSSRGG